MSKPESTPTKSRTTGAPTADRVLILIAGFIAANVMCWGWYQCYRMMPAPQVMYRLVHGLRHKFP
jgi:hypothetical protein